MGDLKYKNSIQINFKGLDKAPTRQEVGLAFFRTFGSEWSAKIASFANGGYFKHLITFKDASNYQSLFGKKLILNEKEYIISDPNNVEIIKTFRILNLPAEFPRAKIAHHISKLGEIIGIKEEIITIEGTNIVAETNIPRFIVKFKKDQAGNIDKIKGVKSINDVRFLITVVGERTPCFLCNDISHWKKDCPKLKVKCTKCNKIGHNDIECSDAKKLFKSSIEILKDFDVNEEDMVEKCEEAEPVDPSVPKKLEKASTTLDKSTIDKTPQAPKPFVLNKVNLNKENKIDNLNEKNDKITRKNKLSRKRSNSSPSEIQPGKKIDQKVDLQSSRSEYESDDEETILNKE